MTNLLTTKEAAEFLGFSEAHLRVMRTKEGRKRRLAEGPPYVKLGGAVRYRAEDLEAYVEKNLVLPECVGAGNGESQGGNGYDL